MATTSDRPQSDSIELPLWQIMDRVRGSEWSAALVVELVSPLAGLLVLRWAAFMEAEQEAVSAFDDKPFKPLLPPSMRHKSWQDKDQLPDRLRADLDNLALRQDVALSKYVGAVACIIRQSAERHSEIFTELVDWVAGLEFETADGRGIAAGSFDSLLERVIERQGKMGGEFTTPQRVVDLMVDLVDPKPGDRVYDPCFGVGGLLVEAARRLRRAVATKGPKQWEEVSGNGIFGVEINKASFVIGLCRIVLAGIDKPGLELGDALERPLPRNRSVEGFDCILAAPPWGGRVSGARTRQYPVPTGGIENLFLQHVMAHLRPGGRAVVALPEGTLFRTGADRQVRKSLLDDFRVDGVISLPEGAFAPCTGIPSSLVVFRRDTPRANVRFIRIAEKQWGVAPGDGFGDGDGNGFGDGDGSGSGAGGGYGLPDGSGFGDGRSFEREHRLGFLHDLSAVVRHERELPKDEALGTRAWEVSIRNLAARDFELLAKKTGAEELEAVLERLSTAESDLRVVPLDQVAKVVQGVSYDRKLTTEHRKGELLAALVRVGDVVEPQVKPPMLFFSAEAEKRIRDEHRLRSGDMLITTSGTVGKIGVIEEGSEVVGALATKSLVVIRPSDGVTSAFLAALLRSPSYKEWFAGHARGSTIQHLSVRTLRKLPIPVPPVQVQDAVLRNLESGGDALGLLLRYIMGGTSDPIAAWLERPAVAALLSEKTQYSDEARALSDAGHEIQKLRPLRNRIAHGEAEGLSEAVSRWLLSAVEAGSVLAGVDDLPEGAPRIAALELAKARLDIARSSLGPDESQILNAGAGSVSRSRSGPRSRSQSHSRSSLIVSRLRGLMAALERLIEKATGEMLGPVNIRIRVHPTEVLVGVPTEVELRLNNESSTGLRSVRVDTSPAVGRGATGYLAEGDTTSIPLTIKAVASNQPLEIQVRWEAVRLDGVHAHGEESLQLLVHSTREAVLTGELGASPYIVGNPVDRDEMFYGRADIIDRIKRQLSSSTNANVILLEGNRRTGKTSILRQLQKKDAIQGWIAVYCSFQDAEGDESRAGISTHNVYRLLARTLGWTLFDAGVHTWFPGEPLPDKGRPYKVEFRRALDRAFAGDHPFETFEEYLAGALKAAKPHRVLLMLDEFDKLQEGIDAGVTSPQVPENIRHILQHHEGLSSILTGSRRLKRLREEYWSALFGLGYRIGISALQLEDARRLVTEPVVDRLSYLPNARDRLVDLCARQPFLVQSLCNRVFERAADSGERTITADMVNEAAIEMVRDNEHFRTLWDYARTHRRRLILALCERLTDGPDAVNLELFATQLESHGVHVPRESLLGDDLEYLRELELIELDKSFRGGTYRIAIPLLAMWIQASIDFEDAVARAKEEAQEA